MYVQICLSNSSTIFHHVLIHWVKKGNYKASNYNEALRSLRRLINKCYKILENSQRFKFSRVLSETERISSVQKSIFTRISVERWNVEFGQMLLLLETVSTINNSLWRCVNWKSRVPICLYL